ncbi:GDCCVxC domain-containing (seleno)protein [Methylotenera sp.]|uniref:GDCCVxC domain-containing (seleno)protein n=1 Tax=Methylotenera sp. TaxID=2051956 RepID=UPI00273646E1|nr:GDCCVxC domain-containing (seleno)protein [Methylotenera sp.]MDP3004656.1 GDCCVxC domain-containing (seleno)protein [Methylotenera sp.]MDP3333382.1 GDCCVxC domain-containing (seleno)protein [Methylococcaceae bacterium]
MRKTILQSKLTCPHCGHQQLETMPVDACQFFYECPNCKILLRPKSGDCCVFCSHGSVKCPPIQAQQDCFCNTEVLKGDQKCGDI